MDRQVPLAGGPLRRGWLFDVNPSLQKQEHSLALDDSLRAPDLEIVRETAPLYRLTADRAEEIVGEVGDAVARWPAVAREVGMSGEEIDRLAAVFLSV